MNQSINQSIDSSISHTRI